MINPRFFFNLLIKNNIDFFCGVPDSLLKDFCAFITDNVDVNNHIIAANEGTAIGLAAGYNMATNKYPLVYMQNSGIGNAVNPLLSLADKEVYSIPMLLLIGWRGEPGVKDEPQHIKQGKVTLSMLDTMGIKYAIMSENELELEKQFNSCIDYLKFNNAPFAFVVKKQTFESYKLSKSINNFHSLTREEAVEIVTGMLKKDDIVISTTGMISRELYEYRERMQQDHHQDFLTVGSMGHASQIALGVAIQKRNRRIFCFDGDGSIIMHMGGIPIIGSVAPNNFYHIVFNNGAHDSVGGQPTVGFKIDMLKIASACGYLKTITIKTKEEFNALNDLLNENGPVFIEIIVNTGARPDLGRPKTSPLENKDEFMNNLTF